MPGNPLQSNRWPLAISALALAVSVGANHPTLRVGHAADAQMPEKGKQALVNLQDAFTSIAESVEPSVVGLHVEPAIAKTTAGKTSPDSSGDGGAPPPDFNPFGDLPFDFGPFTRRGNPQMPIPRQGPATGSGVIVQKTGETFYILTNYHVVEGGGRIKVQLSGRTDEVRGTLVGTDPKTDLAVVKIHLVGAQAERRTADFDDSDNVKVGQWAIAIGDPLDVGETLTVGVVSAKGRALTGQIADSVADYSDMIQTDASINPGNSGGALVDINGKVIGINTAIASPSRGSIGIGFAIPSNVAREIAQQLILRGEVVRGWLGVNTYGANQEIRPALAKFIGVDHGAFVDAVEPNTPAAKAGIHPEDTIIQWGDTPIRTFKDLSRSVGNTPPGRDVPLKLIRHGQLMTVTVHTEKRPSEDELQKEMAGRPANPRTDQGEAAPVTVKAGGITVRPLNASEKQAVGEAGVAVVAVDEGTAVSDALIGPGLVILRVGTLPVRTPAEFKAAMDRIGPDQGYVLRVSAPNSGGAWNQRTISVDPTE